MKILVVGNGQHANKRIIPALKKLKAVKSIIVTDRKSANSVVNLKKKVNTLNHKAILENKEFYDFIIISSYPSSHLSNVEEFKGKTNNLIVEKPITNNISYILSENFKYYYEKNNLIESLMFFHHPFWKYLNTILSKYEFTTLESSFTIPNTLEKSNFRFNKKLGGSAILDNGIYPVSLISELNLKKLQLVKKNISYNNNYSVDMLGSAVFESEDIKKIKIKWGIGNSYNNFVKLTNKNIEIFIPFFFSKPSNLNPTIFIKGKKSITYRNFDQFRSMYSDIFNNNQTTLHYTQYKSIYKRYNLIKMLLNDKL